MTTHMRRNVIHTSVLRLLFCSLLAALSPAGAKVSVAAGAWPPVVDLSADQALQEKDIVDLAAGPGGVVAVWAGGDASPGIVLARRAGGRWTQTTIAPSAGQLAWAPSVALLGSSAAVAWAQGTTRGSCTVRQTIMEKDEGATPRTVMDNVYSPAATPDLATGVSGSYIVFAAAPTSASCGTTDLYYSYRPAGQSSWPAPEVLVAHDAVLAPGAISGSVWHPRIAVDSAGQMVHVVWEQAQLRTDSKIARDAAIADQSVWYVTGTWSSGAMVWSAPTRVSPVSQQYAVRPSVVVGAGGAAHAVWTQLIGSRTAPDEQYIFYEGLAGGTPVTLNPLPIMVNSNFPTLAGSSLTYRDGKLCATWHGYDASSGTTFEEISLRCSDDAGVSWGPAPQNISESAGWLSIYPIVALTDAKVLHLLWVEYELSNNDYVPHGVAYRTNDVGGLVFLPLVVRAR